MPEITEYKDGSWSYEGGGGATVYMTKDDEKPLTAKQVEKAVAEATALANPTVKATKVEPKTEVKAKKAKKSA